MKTLIIYLFLLSIQIFAGIGVGYSGTGALPVELTSFTANLVGKNVELHWATATEVNNYGFELERASLGTTPSQGPWEKIGFVKGNGSSNSVKNYTFIDKTISGGKYNYRLKQVDIDGKFEYSKTVEASLIKPDKFVLEQNYPNPFNPGTVISYSIPASSNVTLKVYDMLGKLITTLVNGNQEAGNYKVYFNAGGLSNGVYFCKLQSGNYTVVNKMLYLK